MGWLDSVVGGLASLIGGGGGDVLDGGFGLDFDPAALDFLPGGATNFVGDLPLADSEFVGDLPLDGEATMSLGDLFSSSDREQFQPTTWENLYNGVTGTDGSTIGMNPRLAGLGDVASAMNPPTRGSIGSGSGGGDGGGGSTSMPVISAPAAAGSVSALQVPQAQRMALPAASAPSEYRPNFQPVPLPQPEEPRGLARLLKALESR